MNNTDVLNNHTQDFKNQLMTLGEFLRFHREQKLISIEELSIKTKIRIVQLTNIEKNNFLELPNSVYLRGFIKSICHELDLSFEQALDYLNENHPTESALEETLLYLRPGKEIKKLPFDFKFFTSPKLKINQKIIILSILVWSLISLLMSQFKREIKPQTLVEVKKMNFIEAKRLIEEDATTELTPPEGSTSSLFEIKDKMINSYHRPILSNDLIEANRKVSSQKIDSLSGHVLQNELAQGNLKNTTTSLTKISVTAKKGDVFLVYRVNNEKKTKFFLKLGKTLELSGNSIRMDVGNPGALEFTKNGNPLEVEANPKKSSLHLEF